MASKKNMEGFAESLIGVSKKLADADDLIELVDESGRELRKKTKELAVKRVNKYTGNYHKSIKKGKVWNKKDRVSVNVYTSDPKGHLIENGHRLISHGQDVGFVEGNFVFKDAYEECSEDFESKVEDMLDGILKELL